VLTAVSRIKGTLFSVPHDVAPTAVGTLTVQLNIGNAAQYEHPNSRVRASIYVFTDAVWVTVPAGSFLWLGGRVVVNGVVNPPPRVSIPVLGPMSVPDDLGQSSPLYDLRGKPVRVELEIERTITVGVTVTSRVP